MTQKKRKQKRKNNLTWVDLTKDFVKEWPEVLDGLEYRNLPIKYVKWCELHLKNKITIRFDIEKDLKSNTQTNIVRTLSQHINQQKKLIDKVRLQLDIPQLKNDMENKTNKLLTKTFKK